jgi:hypothetical protein
MEQEAHTDLQVGLMQYTQFQAILATIYFTAANMYNACTISSQFAHTVYLLVGHLCYCHLIAVTLCHCYFKQIQRAVDHSILGNARGSCGCCL